jgi:hypothetical protein
VRGKPGIPCPLSLGYSVNIVLCICLILVKYFLISAPVDWNPDQYLRRFLLPTGEYVSCVLWYVWASPSYVLQP